MLYVAQVVGARENKFVGSKTPITVDEISPSIIRDTSKCILCGRCVSRCVAAHGTGILGFENVVSQQSYLLLKIVVLQQAHVSYVDNA